MYSFFVDYVFDDSISGFRGNFHGNKFYNVDYYETVDSMIDDVLKLLKKSEAMVTFQCFTGFESVDLLRLNKSYDGTISAVTWNRRGNGYVVDTVVEENIKLDRKAVKKYTIQALELFRAKAAEAA